MAMEHKAFVFRYNAFAEELQPLLESALATGEVVDLVAFIRTHLDELTDPYEGEPLDENWEELVETKDAHQYGDFALTKYYDPKSDVGLGSEWLQVQAVLTLGNGTSALLGTALGPEGNRFDPGKMGSYFQSENDVRANLSAVRASDARLATLLVILHEAATQGAGLYITF